MLYTGTSRPHHTIGRDRLRAHIFDQRLRMRRASNHHQVPCPSKITQRRHAIIKKESTYHAGGHADGHLLAAEEGGLSRRASDLGAPAVGKHSRSTPDAG